ncbi:hypothetical protein FSARC_14725 [Fusarium sarcochroum]|uniref:SGNH hydrolase-type esterase domain-containing protein n=1 Tax=Fusarium sarcochroum TaxID=1208366 RepID=A0A8H4WN80_9HYPO|nr:hypothetical protein FSARC_14725 [Fusarium sarcochroum]
MVSLKSLLAGTSLLLSIWQQRAGAVPTSPNYDEHLGEFPKKKLHRRAEDFYLRIMPLGASITRGEPAPEDTHKNGYRKPLRDQLRSEGWKVNMVGSYSYGEMADNNNEGWPGYVVSAIHDKAKASLPNMKPNLVLINAGTNDAAAKNADIPGISSRMRAMIEECYMHNPDTVVILSTLIPNRDHPEETKAINEQYRNLVKTMQGQAYHIELADMNDGFLTLDGDIWTNDGIHPTVSGFRKMAAVWRHAFGKVLDHDGWLKKAPDVTFKDDDVSGGQECPKVFGNGNADVRAGEQILTASAPFINGDGKYVHTSEPMGTIKKFDMQSEVVLYFAQLVNFGADRGGERDDIVWIYGDSSKAWMYVNEGDGKFSDSVKLDIPDKCKTKGIHWGDVNNDGLDDMICIGPEGDMHVSLNKGGNPPTFEFLGSYFTHPEGYSQKHVRPADIDGDGRLDYCVVADNGDIRCWRNGGLGARAEYWQDLGKVAPGRDMGDIEGVRFVDINGDGRSDWLWIDKTGKVTTFINQRGDGKGMVPSWLDAGVTHGGMGQSTQGREYIMFGRLYDSSRRDYAWLDWGGSCKLTKCAVELKAWKNTGHGGKFQKGDGAKWGDMSGSGFDDYIWVSPDGQINVFQNRNSKPGSTDQYKIGWIDHGVVLKTGMDRKAIHIGDWDGDGKADIIGANKADGALTVWETKFDGKDFSFTKTTPANTNKCTQGWGIGSQDIGLFFADITGSGCVDYICMEPNGKAVAWLNDDQGTMRYAGQIKYSEAKDRANHRFADVNGDDKADFLWVDKFTGDATVWYNNGELPNAERMSGSKFHWIPQGKLYLGSARGPNMHYPNVNGLGRADQVEVRATTGWGYAWYNTCPGGGDDGDEPPKDPGLPKYTPGEVDEPGDDVPDPNEDAAKKFCDANEASWGPKLWKELGMGDWFVTRSTLYSNRPDGWPTPSTGLEKYHGVPRVLAQYNLNDEDQAFNFPTDCLTVGGPCSLDKSTLTDNCHDNWQRAYTLWNIATFVKFVQRWNRDFLDSGLDVDLRLPTMAKTFHPKDSDEMEMDSTSWVVMAAGLLGAVSPYAGAVGPGLGAGSGLLTMVSAMLGWATADDQYDPRFDSYVNLTAKYADLRGKVRTAIADYMESYVSTMPPAGNTVEGTRLAHLLEDGTFTEQDILGDIDYKLFTRWTTAPMIAEIWNSQKVFILKFPKGYMEFTAKGKTFKWDPCHGTKLYEDTISDMTVCTGDNYNYVILGWSRDPDVMFANYGVADLESFNVTKSDMVKSAQHMQDRSFEFMPRRPDFFTSLWHEMADDPATSPDTSASLPVNVPICELNGLEIEWHYDSCLGYSGARQFQYCLQYIALHTCEKYKWQSYPWPYEVGTGPW